MIEWERGGKRSKKGETGCETNEKERMETEFKKEAERNPHFSFEPADSMPRDQTIRPDGFGRLSQFRARKNDGRMMMRRVRESRPGIGAGEGRRKERKWYWSK